MPQQTLKINRKFLRDAVKGEQADELVLRAAIYTCNAANAYADGIPRSGRHRDTGEPNFVVVKEPGRNRVRYTVRPNTAFATWLVQREPARFMATLNAGRQVAAYVPGRR